MSKHLAARRKSAVVKHAEGQIDHPVTQPAPGAFSFRYSSIEISAAGSAARVKRHETRFQNGALKSETFEGTIDRNAYETYVRDIHDRLLHQTSLLMKSMLWFLPARRDDEQDRE